MASLGIGEQADRDAHARHLVGAHHPLAAEPFRLRKRRLDIRDLDVERRHVAGIALRRGADPAADPVRVLNGRVVGRADRLAELPAE